MASDDRGARAPTNNEPSSGESPDGPRPRSRVWIAALLASVLGALLAGCGYWLYIARQPSSAPSIPEGEFVRPGDVFSAQLVPIASEVTSPDATPTDSSVADETLTLEALRRSDRLLIEGHAAEALSSYGRLAHSASPRLYDSLLYRAAVARELLGDLSNALQAYQHLVQRSRVARLVAAGKLGQSRVWILSQKPELAIPVLCQIAMDPIVAQYPDDTLAAEVHHLLGLAFTRQANSSASESTNTVDLLRDSCCARVCPTWTAEYLMSLPTTPKQDSVRELAHGIQVVSRFGDLPTETQLSVSLAELPLAEMVHRIASAAQTKTNWSPAAGKRVARRSAKALAASASLGTLLDNVLAPHDLIWSSQNGEVTIRAYHEVGEPDLAATLQARAVRSLQNASVLYPDHHLAPAAYLSLGNAAFRRSDYEGAEALYRQLSRLFPKTPASVEASFNLAKSLLNRDQRDDAATMFYEVVDSTHGHPLRPVAYLYAGRIHMETGDLNAAIRPLMRATALATDDATKSVAAMTLSSAYLLAENQHAANTVLMEHRDLLKSGASRGVAALLTAMLQLTLSGESPSSGSGRAVIAALNQVTPEDFFGQGGDLLVGRGLASVGLMEQAAMLYDDAVKDHGDAWMTDKMREFLVEYRMLVGEYDKAEEHLEDLKRSANQAVARHARIAMAKLERRKGNDEASTSICRELLKEELLAEQKAELLMIMGRAFEARAKHYEAALCFAGMIPPRSANVDEMRSTLTPRIDDEPADTKTPNDNPDGS